ncbi:MAG: hypothetical protein JSR42_19785 [Proteobacteria bacterium]|nr:hypothetical protein [Pseudomonadota bacterium]
MQIQLLIPGLLWPTATLLGPATGLPLDGLAALLGRGRRQVRDFEPYDRQLARLFGLDADAMPMAMLRRLGEPESPPPEAGGHWLCADPVNLSFAREHMLLQAFPEGEVDAEEASELVAALNEIFADLGRFEACTPTRWYLHLDKPARVTLYPLDDVIGRPVKHFLPEGEEARLWQRTMNEAQIVLHNHARSRAREEAGLRAVNSIWLWGAGEFVRPPATAAGLVQAEDPLSVGLARAAGVRVSAPDVASALRQDTVVVLDSLRKPAQQLDLEAWRRSLEALERDWFAPLAEAFRAGRLTSLRLIAPGDRRTLELELRAADRWKFWRKPHAFEALLKSLAPAPMSLPDAPPPSPGSNR